MKFFVDTAEIDEIRELNELGMVDGVTPDPQSISIFASFPQSIRADGPCLS